MRNSTAKRNNSKNQEKLDSSNGFRCYDWVHSPSKLISGHVVYLVKFLGCAEVDRPKGIDMVRQAVRKMDCSQEMKKSDCVKLPKRELTISMNGVAVQDPKSKMALYQYPLRRISFCADDMGEKRFFSFIAEDSSSGSHMCFVFVSDKLAEEIRQTLGQAFDLASLKQSSSLHKRLTAAERETAELRRRLLDISKLAPQSAVQEYCRSHTIKDLMKVSDTVNGGNNDTVNDDGKDKRPPSSQSDVGDLISDFNTSIVSSTPSSLLDPVSVSTTDSLDSGLSTDSNEQHSPASSFGSPSVIPLPRPRASSRTSQPTSGKSANHHMDLFGAEPFFTDTVKVAPFVAPNQSGSNGDPFGMGNFGNNPFSSVANSDFQLKQEVKTGFTGGLNICTDNFSLDDLDPLKN